MCFLNLFRKLFHNFFARQNLSPRSGRDESFPKPDRKKKTKNTQKARRRHDKATGVNNWGRIKRGMLSLKHKIRDSIKGKKSSTEYTIDYILQTTECEISFIKA